MNRYGVRRNGASSVHHVRVVETGGRDGAVAGVRLHGLYEEEVKDASRVATLLARGNAARVVGRTNMNEQSSRSHTLFRVAIEVREAGKATRRKSVINFVDLAGSERLKDSSLLLSSPLGGGKG